MYKMYTLSNNEGALVSLRYGTNILCADPFLKEPFRWDINFMIQKHDLQVPPMNRDARKQYAGYDQVRMNCPAYL